MVLLIGALVAVFFLIKPFIGSLVLAFTLAVIFYPLYRKLRSLLRGNQSLAALITILVVLVVVLAPLVFLSVQVFQEGRDFYFQTLSGSDTPFFEEKLLSIARWIPGSEQQLAEWSANINQYIQQGLIWLLEHAGVVFSEFARLFFNLFIIYLL